MFPLGNWGEESCRRFQVVWVVYCEFHSKWCLFLIQYWQTFGSLHLSFSSWRCLGFTWAPDSVACIVQLVVQCRVRSSVRWHSLFCGVLSCHIILTRYSVTASYSQLIFSGPSLITSENVLPICPLNLCPPTWCAKQSPSQSLFLSPKNFSQQKGLSVCWQIFCYWISKPVLCMWQ